MCDLNQIRLIGYEYASHVACDKGMYESLQEQ